MILNPLTKSRAQPGIFIGFIIVFYLCLRSLQPVSAAQLVDTIPTNLEHNWTVCWHFASRKSSCENQSLPLKYQSQSHAVKYQTFSKDFILSSDLKNKTIGIWLQHVDDVDEVYVNNHLIGKTGQFLPSFDSGFRYPRLYLIRGDLLHFNRFNHIEIKTFSSKNLPGIQFHPPVIGDYLSIQHKLQENNFGYVVAATILLVLTVFQIFYFVVVKGNYETVYFAMFLGSFAFVSLTRSLLPLDLGLDLSAIFKLETFMLNFSITSLALFIFNFFELEIRRIYSAGLFALGISGVAIVIWPITLNIRQIAEINYWLLIIVTFFVIGSALIIALHKQRKYSLVISATGVSGWLVLIYDATMQSAGIFEIDLQIRPLILPMVAALVGIILALTLTHKYWHFFKGSTYDHLTGTLLRPAFFQRLSEEMQRTQRGGNQLLVAVIDIQQARKISINYGYSIGNHLLTTISNSLTQVLRPFDLICRFSDEQFGVAASISGRQDAESCLKRVYQELINIQQPINQDIELYVDARIGGVIYDSDQHLSVSHLLQDANYALSKAKSQSKHNYLLINSPAATA